MNPARFEVTLGSLGPEKIVVNDDDVTDRVQAVEIRSIEGQPSMLILHHAASAGPITGTGVVQVVSSDSANNILEFLSSIDPGELERQSLDRMGMGDDSVMEQVLEVLKEWSQGVTR